MVKACDIDLPLQIFTAPGSKKRRRMNRNKKKAWRKNIDITDIEDALEDRNREERHGGPIEQQDASDLFSLDLGDGGIEEATDENENLKNKKKDADSKHEGKIVIKRLKCHNFLKGLPGVKPVSKKQAAVPQHNLKEQLYRRVRDGNLHSAVRLDLSVVQSKKALSQRTTHRRKSQLTHHFKKDIWNVDEFQTGPIKLVVKDEVAKTYLRDSMKYVTEMMETKGKKVSISRSSQLKPVLIPKAGASYRPTKEAHQELLRDAVTQIEKRHAKKVKEKNIIELNTPKPEDVVTKEEAFAEVAQGLPSLDDGDIEEEKATEDVQAVTASVVPKFVEKKTMKIRRRERLRAKKEVRVQLLKERKIRETDVFRIKTHKKEFKQVDLYLKKKRQDKDKKNRKAKIVPRKLSKSTMKELDIAVPLPTDIPKSLLECKALANPLDERFQMMQRRNLIEVRESKGRRKQMVKTKPTHKKGLQMNQAKFIMPTKA